jgi:dCTP deaminase
VTDGIFSDRMIEALAAKGAIRFATPLAEGQIQPASLDLRLGARCWRMRASFLPGEKRKVVDRIAALSLHEIPLGQGAVLETGCVYLAEILETFALPAQVAASANPKSSTGRLDVFTRLIVDGAREFDQIPAGYTGRLFAEISPRTFPVLVRTGSRLSQARFRTGQPRLGEAELAALHEQEKLVSQHNAPLTGGVPVSVDLSGFDGSPIIGYRAKRHTGLIDVDRVGAAAVSDYWEAVTADGRGALCSILGSSTFSHRKRPYMCRQAMRRK